MKSIDIIPAHIRYFGIESIDVFCFKPICSELEALATEDISVLCGPKLCRIDSKGLIYDPMLDANEPMDDWRQIIQERYKPINYDFSSEQTGLIATKEFVGDIMAELSMSGYEFKANAINFWKRYSMSYQEAIRKMY